MSGEFKKYDNAITFRQALEDRLKNIAREKAIPFDRDLLEVAWSRAHAGQCHSFGGYEDIFIGHTTTEFYKTFEPIRVCNVWALDTGAGWYGKLAIMDVDSKEYWQSYLSSGLYGGKSNLL